MGIFTDNPSLIQDPSEYPWIRNVKKTPLVLIHDGGGTIFSYYCLGELNRMLYGIHNPHYGTEDSWRGGIPEMAQHYVRLIKSAVPRGDLIIGGWSLGGLIALEVARVLADDSQLHLLGIVMVDSVCPIAFRQSATPITERTVEWSPNTREETKRAVMRCFAESQRMVGEWALPGWDGAAMPAGGGRRAPPRRPPPVVLLRAQEPVPVPEPRAGVSRVDVARADRQLGWAAYRPDLITKVVDVPGHHFNLFSTEEHVDVVTEKIKKACEDIEAMAMLRKF